MSGKTVVPQVVRVPAEGRSQRGREVTARADHWNCRRTVTERTAETRHASPASEKARASRVLSNALKTFTFSFHGKIPVQDCSSSKRLTHSSTLLRPLCSVFSRQVWLCSGLSAWLPKEEENTVA